ncbi:MAG: hypothetical protein JRG82_12585, partial [Deltaproteobacteria bacterium]|nr:hypothetical protein [Deltaproteobacteria bacterium]
MDPEDIREGMHDTPPVERSSTGLDPRLAAALSYLFGFVTGIIFLVVERDSQYVRFHAMQSTVTFISLFVIRVLAEVVPVIGPAVGWLANVGGLVLWALLMIKAW